MDMMIENIDKLINMLSSVKANLEGAKVAVSVVQEANRSLVKDLRDCRNELCLKCGAYKERHLGACDGCRWRADNG